MRKNHLTTKLLTPVEPVELLRRDGIASVGHSSRDCSLESIVGKVRVRDTRGKATLQRASRCTEKEIREGTESLGALEEAVGSFVNWTAHVRVWHMRSLPFLGGRVHRHRLVYYVSELYA